MKKVLLCAVVVFLLAGINTFLALRSTGLVVPHAELLDSILSSGHLNLLVQELASYKSKVQELEQHVAQLNSQLATCQEADGERQSGTKQEREDRSESVEWKQSSRQEQDQQQQQRLPSARTFSSAAPSPYCSIFPHPISSTLGVWNSRLGQIVEATRHELDKRWVLHDFTAQLLHLVSPDRLARSTMSLPHDWTPVQNALKVVYSRHVFETNRERQEKQQSGGDGGGTTTPPLLPKPPRKLKILIMGGSLIVGVNCRRIVKDNNLGMMMPNRLCTWTHRLESFLNNMFGGDYVEVHKIALGGTNTQTGFVMWDSNFLPDETKNPDIVINAYSTNDMHILTALQAKDGNLTMRDKVLEMTQDFVRSVLKDGPCAPLLLHMDDYLGNEQREVLATTELAQATMVLANYYGFTSMSYANVVRDIVYGDTYEYWISPQGWYEDPKDDTMVREIHPGMGMHIISTWVAAYNMLHLALTFCSMESFWNATVVVDHNTVQPYQVIHGLPKLRGNPNIPGKPKGRPAGLPPPLIDSLSLENITQAWKAATPIGSVCPDDRAATSTSEDRCPFSWFSGISKLGENETYAHDLFSTGNVLVAENTGWGINTAGKKLGISPAAKRKESFLKFKFEGIKLRSITIFYMKSYGKQWENSRIALTVTTKTTGSASEVLQHDELEGIHDKQTSETYTHRIDLLVSSSSLVMRNGNATTMEVTIQHIGGETFKIMGLAICK